MAKTKPPDIEVGMLPNDPRRPLKINRLRSARGRIDEFAGREPRLDDPDYTEWDRAVRSLLTELFGASSYLLRFRQLTVRPISYSFGGSTEWSANPKESWEIGLRQAARILDEALEEAEIKLPDPESARAGPRTPTPLVVNISNQNVFSPEIHITISQVLQRLDGLGLSASEKALATEQVQELEAETKGEKRWPMIARSLEAIKSMGKSVYKEVAVPLLVEFLKHEAGLAGHH